MYGRTIGCITINKCHAVIQKIVLVHTSVIFYIYSLTDV